MRKILIQLQKTWCPGWDLDMRRVLSQLKLLIPFYARYARYSG